MSPTSKSGGALHLRRAAQPALQGVGPAVVLAAQGVRALAVAQRQRAGAVAADVGEGAQHAVLAAHHDHRQWPPCSTTWSPASASWPAVRDQLPAAREYRALFLASIASPT